jgi:NLE (NUC135) domain
MSGDPFKRRKVDPTQALAYKPLPSAAAAAATTSGDAPPQRANVIAQLVSRDGTPAGPQLDVPADVTPKQLEELLNGLLGQNDSPTPYTFYAADAELLSDLGSHLQGAGASVEGVLQITYQVRACAWTQDEACLWRLSVVF